MCSIIVKKSEHGRGTHIFATALTQLAWPSLTEVRVSFVQQNWSWKPLRWLYKEIPMKGTLLKFGKKGGGQFEDFYLKSWKESPFTAVCSWRSSPGSIYLFCGVLVEFEEREREADLMDFPFPRKKGQVGWVKRLFLGTQHNPLCKEIVSPPLGKGWIVSPLCKCFHPYVNFFYYLTSIYPLFLHTRHHHQSLDETILGHFSTYLLNIT